MTGNFTKTITVTIKKDMLELLDSQAKKHHSSRSAYIASLALQDYKKENG